MAVVLELMPSGRFQLDGNGLDANNGCVSVCLLQLIFRKVSDMKREKELAEKRKNEPKMDQSQDHLVRKLFSRFRKGGSASSSNLLSNVSVAPCCSSATTLVTSATPVAPPNGPASRAATPDVERGDESPRSNISK